MPDEFLSEHSNSTMDAELLEAGPSAAATAAPCVAMPPHPATSTSPPASSLPPPTPPPSPPTAATRRGPHVPQNEDEQDERIRELDTQLAQTLQEAKDLKAQRQSQALLAADAADGRVAAPIPLSGVATMEGPRAIVVSLEIRPDRVRDFLAAINRLRGLAPGTRVSPFRCHSRSREPLQVSAVRGVPRCRRRGLPQGAGSFQSVGEFQEQCWSARGHRSTSDQPDQSEGHRHRVDIVISDHNGEREIELDTAVIAELGLGAEGVFRRRLLVRAEGATGDAAGRDPDAQRRP